MLPKVILILVLATSDGASMLSAEVLGMEACRKAAHTWVSETMIPLFGGRRAYCLESNGTLTRVQ